MSKGPVITNNWDRLRSVCSPAKTVIRSQYGSFRPTTTAVASGPPTPSHQTRVMYTADAFDAKDYV